jgi:hypothetical protein
MDVGEAAPSSACCENCGGRFRAPFAVPSVLFVPSCTAASAADLRHRYWPAATARASERGTVGGGDRCLERRGGGRIEFETAALRISLGDPVQNAGLDVSDPGVPIGIVAARLAQCIEHRERGE